MQKILSKEITKRNKKITATKNTEQNRYRYDQSIFFNREKKKKVNIQNSKLPKTTEKQ